MKHGKPKSDERCKPASKPTKPTRRPKYNLPRRRPRPKPNERYVPPVPSLSVAELEQAQAERDALAPFGESWSEDDGPMREWISHQSSLADVNCEFRGDYAAWWFDVYRTPPPPDCTSERRLLFAIASRREGVRLPPREQRKLDALALRLGPAPEVKRDQQTEALVAAHGLPAVLHSHLWELARRHRLFWWPGLFQRPAVPLPEDSRLWRANPQLWSDAEFEQLGRLPDGGVRFPGVYPAQPGGIPHAWDSAWCTEDNGVRHPYAEGGAGEVWPAEPFAGVELPWKKACHELTLFHAPDELNIWAQVLDACEGEVVPVLYAAAFKPFWARPLASFALEGSPHDCVNGVPVQTILREVLSAVSGWRKTGLQLRIKTATIDTYASAFEQPLMNEARGVTR